MALSIYSEKISVGVGVEKLSSGQISSSTTTSTMSSRATAQGLSVRVGAGGVLFSAQTANKKPAVSVQSSSPFLKEVMELTARNAKKGKEWFGEEYVPVMTNSILPYRKLGDESDIVAILKKAEAGGRGIGEERSKPDTIVSVCGIESNLIEQLWAEIKASAKPSAEFKYRDLRVVRIEYSSASSGTWSFMKPTAGANTKPYVVDSALFLSDMAIIPIDLSGFASLSAEELKLAFIKSLSHPASNIVKRAEGSSYMRAATSYLQTASSLYNTLVKLQVIGGRSSSAGQGGLLRNTTILLFGSSLIDGDLHEIEEQIFETANQIMKTFGTEEQSEASLQNFSVRLIPSAHGHSGVLESSSLMNELAQTRRKIEAHREILASKLQLNQGLRMQVVCVFSIDGDLIVCTRILTGSVAVGEVIEIGPFPGVKDSKYEQNQLRRDTWRWSSDMSFSVTETVEAIKHYDKFVSTAYAGQLVGIRISRTHFNLAGTPLLKSSVVSSTSRRLASSRAFSIHTGLLMTSTKWRSEEDCPVDVAIPSVSELVLDSLVFTSPDRTLVNGRRYHITFGSFEGEGTLVDQKASGTITLRLMISDSFFVRAPLSATVVSTAVTTADNNCTASELITVSAGGLVVVAGKVAQVEYRCRKLLSTDFTAVVMILRRILPYELVHTLLEYATPDAIKPFSGQSTSTKPATHETKQERRL